MADLPETEDGEYDHDFRADPEPYRVGRGEEGVFKVQPYKSELLPRWGYADPATAADAAESIYEQFLRYRRDEEFVGMDLARKYLQMGYTRAMRYAHYPGGKKYDADGTEREKVHWADPEKRKAALIFDHVLGRVEADEVYQTRKREWREQRG
ncbi:DUF4385 family protein [Halolamina salifodinae]